MSEGAKQNFSKVYSILLLILAVVFTVMSFMPVISMNTSKLDYPEVFTKGRFTSKCDQPNEIGFGLGTVIKLALDLGDIIDVVSIQTLDATIENTEDVEERAKLVAKRDEKLKDITEDGIKALEEKIENDKEFANNISVFYGFIGSIGASEEDAAAIEGVLSESGFGRQTLSLTTTIIGVVSLIALIGIGLVFPIIILIKCIILVIKTLLRLKKDSDTDLDNRMDRFPFTAYTGVIFVFFLLYSMTAGGGIGLGKGILGAAIIFLIVCALRAVKTILFAEKKDIFLILIKQGISAISILALIFVLINFTGIGLIDELDKAVDPITNAHYLNQVQSYTESGMDMNNIHDAAKSDVASANGINTAIVVSVAIIGAMIVVFSIVNATERFANKKTKSKTGELIAYKAMTVASVFILIIAIIPSLFSVNSAEAKEEAYKDGSFKIWYTEYEEEGTIANLEYKALVEFKKQGDESLPELESKLESISGEEREAAEKYVDDIKHLLKTTEEEIKDIEAKPSRPVMCIVFAVIFLIAEYSYLIVPKVLSKKKKDDGSDSAVEAEAPAAEEAVAEEAVAEEAVTEEAVTEEAVAEAVVAEAAEEPAKAE